jgi:hypothetical protein
VLTTRGEGICGVYHSDEESEGLINLFTNLSMDLRGGYSAEPNHCICFFSICVCYLTLLRNNFLHNMPIFNANNGVYCNETIIHTFAPCNQHF